ncbi:unnamed protein product [Closterium sp. Yama58-4]|nr:unnamed protein product [Closterium sp. Yama58-4]
MTGRRRPPRRDVIVAAGSPAVPIQPAVQGGQVPVLFRAVADCLTAGAGSAPSVLPSDPVRPREPVYRSPRGRTHPYLRARGQSFRRRRPPRPLPSRQACLRPQPRPPPAQSQPLQLPPPPDESASSHAAPSHVPAQSAPPAPHSRQPPSAPVSAPSPQSQAPVPAPPPVQSGSLPSAGAPTPAPPPASASGSLPPLPQPGPPSAAPPSASPPNPPFAYSYPPRLDATAPAPPAPRWPLPATRQCQPRRQHPLVPRSRLPHARFGFVSGTPSRSPLACRALLSLQCCSPPCCSHFSTLRRSSPLLIPQHQPVPGLPRGYWNDDEVPGTPRDPDVGWWAVPWPHARSEADGSWGAPPPDAPWGEPRPGDGAYQARGLHLSDVGRCVTELSFVLDLLHDALQSREVVARDPQQGEDQQARARRAVSGAMWDLLRLPLEPEDPSLDDGPGAAAFRMVAMAVEESPLGIVPAIACVLRWLGRRVERMQALSLKQP